MSFMVLLFIQTMAPPSFAGLGVHSALQLRSTGQTMAPPSFAGLGMHSALLLCSALQLT